MKKIFLAFVVLILVAGLYLYVSAPISPVAWEPVANPGLTGEYAPNNKLGQVERLLPGLGEGPEAVACGNDGNFYTGLKDGRIIRFNAAGDHSVHARTGGRPLGMKADGNGRLIVADGIRGLLSVSPDGEVEVLTNSVDGKAMLFVDDLDIAEDGTIWFSDASTRHGYHHSIMDFMEGRRTGRLLSYHPGSGETKVHIDGMFFANGVALGPEDAYVLINETGTGLIHRLWLKGAQAGTRELFHAGLPGAPDNITFNGTDTFWVAMPSLREGVDGMASNPLLRRFLSNLPLEVLFSNAGNYSFVLGLDLSGEVVANLQDTRAGFINITSAVECDDFLYLGSLTMPSLARYSLLAAGESPK